MKRVLTVALLSLLCAISVCAAFSMAGCLGNHARTAATEAFNLADEGIAADARSGAKTDEDRAVIEKFYQALETKDRTIIVSDAIPVWAQVKAMAEAGIAARVTAGSIGPGVALSKRERLMRFQDTINKMVKTQ